MLFCAAILSFVWTTGSNTAKPSLPSPHTELALRIFITLEFMLSFAYLGGIVRTFLLFVYAQDSELNTEIEPDGKIEDISPVGGEGKNTCMSPHLIMPSFRKS